MPLERQGVDRIHFTDTLADRTSPSHQQLTEAAREGLERMVMQSNLRDIYYDIVVSGFEPSRESDRAAVVYVVRVRTGTFFDALSFVRPLLNYARSFFLAI